MSSLTLALARSTPAISLAIDTWGGEEINKVLRNPNLVGLLVGVGPVGVREVDVAVGLHHDAPDGVAALADDVRVVGVSHVHLHGDPGVGGGVEHLGDHGLGPLHALLGAAHPDVRVLLAIGADLEPGAQVTQ